MMMMMIVTMMLMRLNIYYSEFYASQLPEISKEIYSISDMYE